MGRIEIVATEEDRVYASKRDWQCPDVPFAPIDKHHAISNLKICWSFFFSSSKSSLPPQSCVLKRALSETLRFFPLLRKVVDFTIIPSLSGREECGVYWKELDVLYHRSDDESDDDEPNEMAKMIERVQRETKPLTIPRRSCMTVQKTNVVCVQDQREGEEERWVVLTFFVRHYACDGDSLKMFLSFFCHVIEEQHEQQQRIQHQKPFLLPKRRVNGLQLPTSKRVEYFQLSKNEKMKVKEHGEFIALPQLIEHGCVKIRPSRAIRGILVGSLKYIFSKTTRIQIKLTDEFIREMKERTAERAPVEDYIVEDDFVSTNDIATAFAWNFLSLLKERKKKKKEPRKKPSYCNIAINYRNYGVLPKNYFGNASFAHVIAVDDVYANVEKRAREIRRSLQKYREGDPRAIDSRIKARLALGSLDKLSLQEHLISLHSMLNLLDLSCTNWMTFDFYNLEFGRGVKATHFDGYVTPHVPNTCAIIPTRNGNGCKIVLEIRKKQVKKATEIIRGMLVLDDDPGNNK